MRLPSAFAAGLAYDVSIIHAALPSNASADAFAEVLDLIHSVLVPDPDREKVAALKFAIDVFRRKA